MKTITAKKLISIAAFSIALNSANPIFAASPTFNAEMLSFSSNAPYVTSNGIVYNFIKEPGNVSLGEVAVGNNRTLRLSNVEIPNTITIKGKSYAVVEIAENAFSSNTDIQTISFGKSVKTIAPTAFLNCPSLKEITAAPDSPYFTSDNGVLYNSLYKNIIKYPEGKEDKSYTLNSSTTEVNDFAFYKSQFLEEISSQNLFKVNKYAFAECPSLKNVSLGANVTEIKDYAFFKSGISSITLPPTITSIGKGAFAFSNIARIALPTNLNKIEESTFYSCENLSDVKIGNGTIMIGDFAFSNTNISEIEFPNNIAELGKYAFAECQNLKKVKLNSILTKIDNYAFNNCSSIKTIDIPKSLITLGEDVFTGCTSLETFTAKSGSPKACTIENGILYNSNVTTLIHYPSSNLATIYTIPSSVSKIEENALADSKYINEFIADEGAHNFYTEDGILYDYHITNIIKFPVGKGGNSYMIPDTVTKISNKAFKNSDLSGIVNLPSRLKTIGKLAFDGCKNITAFNSKGKDIISENGVLYTSDKTELIQFPAKSSIIDFEVPETVKTIREGAFSGTKLNSITLNAGLETISDYAFSNTKLETIELPDTLKEIGDYAFSNSVIKSVKFPASIEKIGDFSFKNCENLIKITFTSNNPPDSIGSNAFLNCPAIETIILPSEKSVINYLKTILTLNIDNIENYIKLP